MPTYPRLTHIAVQPWVDLTASAVSVTTAIKAGIASLIAGVTHAVHNTRF